MNENAKITFYVAECMEFPDMGEHHENIANLQDAITLYEQMSNRMGGVKGIGFTLTDGSIYDGMPFTLMSGGRVDRDLVEYIPHYKESPLVQKALTELEKSYPAKTQENEKNGGNSNMKKNYTNESSPINANEGQDAKISFYVGECMENPDIGIYQENIQSLQEAIDLYDQILANRMVGERGLGFVLTDGSIYDGKHRRLMTEEYVDRELVEKIPHYKESPLVQKALSELEKYVHGKELQRQAELQDEREELREELSKVFAQGVDPNHIPLATIETDIGIMTLYYNGTEEEITAEKGDYVEGNEYIPDNLDDAIEVIEGWYWRGNDWHMEWTEWAEDYFCDKADALEKMESEKDKSNKKDPER